MSRMRSFIGYCDKSHAINFLVYIKELRYARQNILSHSIPAPFIYNLQLDDKAFSFEEWSLFAGRTRSNE